MPLLQQADAFEKSDLERRKVEAGISKDTADTLTKHLQYQKQLAGSVFANPSPQAAVAALQEWQARTGQDVTRDLQAVQGMNPDQVKQWAAGKAFDADKFLPVLAQVNTGKQTLFRDTNVLTNPGGVAPITMTTTPDADQRDNTARANNAASIAAQIRGQNMSDTRAREANAINREAQQTQLVNDPVQGLLLVNKGTKTAVQAAGPDGKPIPSESSAKRVSGARRVLGLLDEAEKIIPGATGSYAGVAIDEAARAVGASTRGAENTGRLKAIEGSLLSEMPRMEGPQSNIDVAMYKQAAGDLGNPTVPRATKLAAIKTIRRIQSEYAGAPSQATPANAAPNPPAGGKPNVSNW
jgi:hypothetical protein